MSAPSLPRFFSHQPLVAGTMRLEGDEAHHLSHVLRLGAGAEVALFDGSGREVVARIAATGRHAIELVAGQPAEVSRELAFPVRLAVSLPKGDRQKILIEKLTELGVAELVPLVTRRGVAQPGTAALERLRRTVIAACKQCGRNRLMAIAEPRGVSSLAQSLAGGLSGWFADPDSGYPSRVAAGTVDAEWFAVGPEGGFDRDEIDELVAAGWQGFRLGPAILRIETAAVAIAAVRAAQILGAF